MDEFIAKITIASKVRPQEQIVESGTVGLAYELNGITCSVHHDLIGLLVNIAKHKVESLVDSSALYKIVLKQLVDQ